MPAVCLAGVSYVVCRKYSIRCTYYANVCNTHLHAPRRQSTTAARHSIVTIVIIVIISISGGGPSPSSTAPAPTRHDDKRNRHASRGPLSTASHSRPPNSPKAPGGPCRAMGVQGHTAPSARPRLLPNDAHAAGVHGNLK